MARVLTFSGMEPGTQTWYKDLDTGGTVQVFPGDVVPVRVIDEPEQYVTQGVAAESGVEDGTDGKIDVIADDLRALLVAIAEPVDGNDPSTWLIDDMILKIQDVQAADTQAALDWPAAAVVGTTPADGATAVAANPVVKVQFDKAMDPDTFGPGSIFLRDQSEAQAHILTSAVVYDANDANQATATLESSPLPGITYKIRLESTVTNAAGNPLAATYNQTSGFAMDAAPTVVDVTPADEATGVALNTTVVVEFDKAMASIVVKLYDVTAASESAALSMSEVGLVWTSTAQSLISGHVYKVRVYDTSAGENGFTLAETNEQITGFTTV